MAKSKASKKPTSITEAIIFGIQEKKGNEIVRLDLRNIHSSAVDYLIVCHAASSMQVRAIAENVEKEVHKALKQNPWQKEGWSHGEWILLDYIDVVVHIFKTEKRAYYSLETLWGDAEIQLFKSA